MDHASPQPLILTSLAKAVDSLADALAQPKNPYTRDATIQRFEYTFELAWKLLKRYLTSQTLSDIHNVKDLFREAGRQGLIGDVESWFTYLKGRNLTSHTHNEKTAEETYLIAAAFLPDAQALLTELEARNGTGRH